MCVCGRSIPAVVLTVSLSVGRYSPAYASGGSFVRSLVASCGGGVSLTAADTPIYTDLVPGYTNSFFAIVAF